MTTVHIKMTQTHDARLAQRQCPDCGRLSWFVQCYEDWYGADSTCLRCGRHWSDGEWMPLMFSRNARQNNIDAAKKRFRRYLAAVRGAEK